MSSSRERTFLSACRAASAEARALRWLFLLVVLLATAPKLPTPSADTTVDGFWGRLTLCLAGASDDHGGRVAGCPACIVVCGGALAAPAAPAITPATIVLAHRLWLGEATHPAAIGRRADRSNPPRAPPRAV